jgi:hypothetical protein
MDSNELYLMKNCLFLYRIALQVDTHVLQTLLLKGDLNPLISLQIRTSSCLEASPVAVVIASMSLGGLMQLVNKKISRLDCFYLIG